jgi:hypothetical protein
VKCSQFEWKNVVLVVMGDNAIIGGYDLVGEPLYICRTKYRGSIIPRKAKPNEFGCAITSRGKEGLFTKNYELLIGPHEMKFNRVSNEDNP